MFYFVTVFLFITFSSKPITASKNVSIEVYYECLCPDSVNFITRQLYPTYKTLGKYIDIELIPAFGEVLTYNFLKSFANMSFLQYEADGTGGWEFTCQHGPNECIGNLYQVCLLDMYRNQNDQIELINCIESDRYPHQATEKVIFFVYIAMRTAFFQNFREINFFFFLQRRITE